MPDTLTYKSRGCIGIWDSNITACGDTICYVGCVPEGYTKFKVHFEYENVTEVEHIEIRINDNVVYTGLDSCDKEYSTSKYDSISVYTMFNRKNLSGEQRQTGNAYVYITLYK